MDGTRHTRTRLAAIAGLLAGALTGIAAATVAGAAVAERGGQPAPFLEATHLPPLLTAAGEVVELRYDVYCVGGDDPEAECDADGIVFLRAGDRGPFHELALAEDPTAAEGRLVATVPAAIARSSRGFAYYAVFRSEQLGSTITLPSAGREAPQRSLPLERSVQVTLAAHEFGGTRAPDARVLETAWGEGPGQVGLEEGRNLTPIGGSSFDVGRDESIHVLDEANRRVLRWTDGIRAPTHVPLPIAGALADLAVADDGTMYVLETTSDGGSVLLRAFTADGSVKGSTEVAERASQVRIGAGGQPVLLQQPSGLWMAAEAAGRLLGPSGQRLTGRPGRPLRGGGEVVVLRRAEELRVALVGESGARRSWRISSETPLAEVQLAEPLGGRLLVVVRVYSETVDEFLALVLGNQGLVSRFSLDSADWAETAPLSRFRLAGSSLYRLGSSPTRLFVDRFDLEVG